MDPASTQQQCPLHSQQRNQPETNGIQREGNMAERAAADAVLIIHLMFILFAVAGGLLVLRRRWLMVLHLPTLAWAVLKVDP